MVVEIANKLAAHITLLGFKLRLVELWLSDSHLLQLQNTLPLKIRTVRHIHHRQVARPGIVVGTVFNKLCLVLVLARKLSISTKGHMLHNVRRLVDVLARNIAVARPELELEAHHGCARHVDEKAAGTIL